MYSTNRIGQNRPLCNNRQFITMGIINHQPEEMKLKPEYLGNEHFKFLNDFGLQQQFITDKKFLDINNSVNRHSPNNCIALNSSYIMHTIPNSVMVNCTANYHTSAGHNIHKGVSEKPFVGTNFEKALYFENKAEDTNKIEMVANKPERINRCRKSPPRGCEESQGCSNIKLPKKSKRNNKTQYDKVNQKSSKKSKRQKNYQKQSKRESDRNIIGNSCSRKRKEGKPWHKESLEKEFMDIDDVSFYSYSDHSLESPIITAVCSAPSMPNIQSVYVESLSSPVKVFTESKTQNNKSSPPVCGLKEQHDISMGNSPKQNNFRPRLPSECESEDSFIVFEESSKSIDLDDDQESSDFDSSSDEDSDNDDDDMDFCTISHKQNHDRLNNFSPSKKVRFAPGKDLCEVHPMVQWSFAYQKARKGPWEQYAVDRMRFKNRISDVEPILNVVLQPGHRREVYQERFLQEDN